MAETQGTSRPHSAEFFNDMREFWWNRDFLELMARRLELDRVRSVLDVGCGVGHWGRALALVLPAEARVTGVDREAQWVMKATEHARQAGLADRFTYQQGDAMTLPFADGTFDLVTCQTVLMHVADPAAGIREMRRVVKPGGVVLAVEPSNLPQIAVLSSVSDGYATEEVLDTLRLHLVCQRGKRALGEGNNNVGDLLPGMFAREFGEVSVWMSDRATPSYPPYALGHQSAEIAQVRDWYERGHWVWDEATTRRYFAAGGGSEEEFARLWAMTGKQWREMLEAVEAGRYHCGGAGVSYIVAGRKE